MVLPGMRLAVTLGYITGVFIVARPWGNPKFTWFSLPIFLSLLYIPCFVFCNVDIIYHYQDKLTAFGEFNPDRVDNLVAVLTYAELLISSIAMRLIFLLKARKISELLERFRKYAKVRLDWRGPNTNADTFFCALIFLSTFSVGVTDGVDFYYYGQGRSWIREWMGALPHSLSIVIMFDIPTMIPIQCAFVVIVSFTGYLALIFQDYCQHVLDLVRERKYSGMSIIVPPEPHGPFYKKPAAAMEKTAAGHFTEQLRRETIEKFEIIREMYDLVHEIISPMAMVLLSGSCIAVVMKGYEVLLLRRNSIVMARDICHLLNYVSYYWILQCGQRLADKMDGMKTKLDDTLVDLSSETYLLEKQTVKDVQSAIKLWNWKFTAYDIFVIDRSLASGVVSLIMTYVIVLVQLKVSDAPDSVD